MLWLVAITLGLLWLFGMLTGYTLDGLIHVLLAIACVVLVLGVVSRHRRI